MTENMIELAKAVAKEVKKLQPVEPILLSFDEVCVFLGYSPKSSTAAQVIKDPTFPRPFSLVDKGNRRWRKSDVANWVDYKYREEEKRELELRIAGAQQSH
jgi:predicted DNA-binding transcriptional regulator AlpA